VFSLNSTISTGTVIGCSSALTSARLGITSLSDGYSWVTCSIGQSSSATIAYATTV
jgi:hypothetical protein